MPNFTPNSEIHIGRVPWDNSYKHTRTFSSRSAQATWMLNRCDYSLGIDNYTYVRMNNAIRVPFNAESLYTYNYVMYKNKNYGDKWFYAFIISVNYVNENMTELVLQLDVMQTWYFDYTVVQGFIEREHVNDDTVGAHLNAEPDMDMVYTYDSFSVNIMRPGYVILLLNALPVYADTSTTKTMGSEAVSGGMYQRFYSGCKPVVFKTYDADSMNMYKKFMEDINACGAADSICDAFTVPVEAISPEYLSNLQVKVISGASGQSEYVSFLHVWTVVDNAPIGESAFNVPKPTSLDGYTPRNKKVLTYPYCYFEIGDFSGRKQQYRYEFFDSSRAYFSDTKCGISDCIGYITPLDYNKADDEESDLHHYAEPFTYSYSNKLSWVYSAYQTWMSQNALSNQLAVMGSAVGAALGVAGGMGAIQNTLSHKEGMNDAAVMGAAIGLGGIGSVLGAMGKMSRVPNVAKGNTEGNSKLQNDYSGYYRAGIALKAEFARIVDDFFSMYGYQVNIVKLPNIYGRRSWNYVKMANSCHRGNVPAEDMALINSIYNAGITFWHVDDIGNYSLNNSIS